MIHALNKLRATDSNPDRGKDAYLYHSIQTGSYPMGILGKGGLRRGLMLNIYIELKLRHKSYLFP
jgi:hypothetical protein